MTKNLIKLETMSILMEMPSNSTVSEVRKTTVLFMTITGTLTHEDAAIYHCDL